MVSDMTDKDLDAVTIRGLDAPYPDESYKGGPRRMPMMIPATFLHPAAAPNARVWDKLSEWKKPTLTQVSESIAAQSFDPKMFHDQIPGTAGQPHQTVSKHGVFPDRRKPGSFSPEHARVYRAVLKKRKYGTI